MDEKVLERFALVDQQLNNDLLVNYFREHGWLKNLVFCSLPDSVGIAFENGEYVVYMNNELGQREYEKQFKSFKGALNFARELYSDLCYVFEKIEGESE